MSPRPVVSLLTDFGVRDPSGAICEGVILGICPEATVVHISHEVTKYAIRDGALMLWCAVPFMPVGVHMAVVDPGVGTARRPVALVTQRGDVLIGPDNGLLMPGAERLGGVVAAHELTSEAHRPAPGQHQLPRAGHLRPGGRTPRQRPGRGRAGPGVRPGHPGRARHPAGDAHPRRRGHQRRLRRHLRQLQAGRPPADLEASVGPMRPGRAVRVEPDGAAGRDMGWADTFGDVPVGTRSCTSTPTTA